MEEGFKKFINRAEAGDIEAQVVVGDFYYNGIGVEQDHKRAIYWYTKAAYGGDAEAQFKMGEYYRGGIATEINESMAKTWYTRAAEQGHAEAQDALRKMGADRDADAKKFQAIRVTDQTTTVGKRWFSRKTLALGVVLIALLGFLMNWAQAEEYTKTMTTVCAKMTDIHENTLREMDTINEENHVQIADNLAKQCVAVEELKVFFEGRRTPIWQNDDVTKVERIFELEKRILTQMESLCRDPLTAEHAAKLQEISEWIKRMDQIYLSIESDKTFAEVPSIEKTVDLLRKFVNAENDPKKIEMRKAFVKKVEAIIQDHKDVESWWNTRKNADSMYYFAYRAEMRAEKVLLLMRARDIKVPKDAKKLAEKLEKTLDLELRYYDELDAIPEGLPILEKRDAVAKASDIHSEAMKVRYEFAQEFQAYKVKYKLSNGISLFNSYPW